jgi:hypothetical protein
LTGKFGRFEGWQIMGVTADPAEMGFSHYTFKLHLARLERQGMEVKANGACASKLPPNPKRGIDTILNHFGHKPER